MQENTPPHEDQFEDFDIGEVEEVIDDGDDQNFLDESSSDNEEMEEDNEQVIEEEGDEIKANPVICSFHEGSVFRCALSPKDNIGVSGGGDERAFVWDTVTGSTIFECTGHKESVTEVSFSHTGEYLATGDIDGFIQVWKVATESRVWEFESGLLTWMLWHQSSNILFAGTLDGEVWMWLIPKGNTKMLAHAGVSSESGCLTRDGKRLCVGYKDGNVRIIDLKSGETLHTVWNHTAQINSLSTHSDNTLLLAGSLDGYATILNSATGKIVGSLMCGINPQEDANSEQSDLESEEILSDSVEEVSFCPSMPNIAVTATLSSVITVWDVSAQVSRHRIEEKNGTSVIAWHPTKPYLLAAGLDGVLRVYDVRSAELLYTFRGHQNSILSCDISKDGNKVITSSDDGTVRILNTETLFNS